jgi:hypothetical protein
MITQFGDLRTSPPVSLFNTNDPDHLDHHQKLEIDLSALSVDTAEQVEEAG